MYQEGGRAILGWRAGKTGQTFKNLYDRGITGSFDTEYANVLKRAVLTLLPEYSHVRWYAGEERACYACARYFDLWTALPVVESPVVSTSFQQEQGLRIEDWLNLNGITIWRPWLDDAWFFLNSAVPFGLRRQTTDAVVVTSPLPVAGNIHIVAYSDAHTEKIVPSDSVPAVMLGALARSFYDLNACIPRRGENEWSQFDRLLDVYWRRGGPYLVPLVDGSEYYRFFCHCLDCGIFISPFMSVPSIVPPEASQGDFSVLEKKPFR